MKRETTFSHCRKYRYTLWREFECDDIFQPAQFFNSFAQFICLNPSTADENNDDPTVRRCIQFSKDWGYGAFCMTNIFGFRATDPNVMKAQDDPIGCDNTNQIREIAEHAGIIIAAWGRHGFHLYRQAQVLDALQPWKEKVHCLGLDGMETGLHPPFG